MDTAKRSAYPISHRRRNCLGYLIHCHQSSIVRCLSGHRGMAAIRDWHHDIGVRGVGAMMMFAGEPASKSAWLRLANYGKSRSIIVAPSD